MHPLPPAPAAFVWLRLYRTQISGLVSPSRDEALSWTLQHPFRALNYRTARAMFARVNAGLGANWPTAEEILKKANRPTTSNPRHQRVQSGLEARQQASSHEPRIASGQAQPGDRMRLVGSAWPLG